jgi:hypothetical protein
MKTFSINEKQEARFQQWIGHLGRERVSEAVEEDCAVSSPFTWTFNDLGISCLVTVEGFGETLDLTLDDDGEFLNLAPWENNA